MNSFNEYTHGKPLTNKKKLHKAEINILTKNSSSTKKPISVSKILRGDK